MQILAGFHVELIETTDEVLDKLFDTTMNPDKTIEEVNNFSINSLL